MGACTHLDLDLDLDLDLGLGLDRWTWIMSSYHIALLSQITARARFAVPVARQAKTLHYRTSLHEIYTQYCVPIAIRDEMPRCPERAVCRGAEPEGEARPYVYGAVYRIVNCGVTTKRVRRVPGRCRGVL